MCTLVSNPRLALLIPLTLWFCWCLCLRTTFHTRALHVVLCSRPTESSSAGTWTLNVLWKMCGIDVHMDPNIGKRLNALGNTLTSLTGEEDTEDAAERTSPMADLSDEDDNDTMSPSPHMVRPGTTTTQ